jgi:hypothetical protein
MGTREPEILDDGIESLLRRSQPRPEHEFVTALRSRLFPDPTVSRSKHRPRPLLVAAVGATGAALASVVLSLAGVGPLAGRGSQDVRARSGCRYVTVKQRARVPVVARTSGGQARIIFRTEPVERRVKRCR